MKHEIFEPYECDSCGSTNIEHVSTVTYKRIDFNTYKCKDCGYIMSDEPDWDSLPGGHDDR